MTIKRNLVVMASLIFILTACSSKEYDSDNTTISESANSSSSIYEEEEKDVDKFADSGSSAILPQLKDGEVAIDEDNFPDDIFRNYVLSTIDVNGDKILQEDEIQLVTEIDVSGMHDNISDIKSLEGIAIFTELTELSCKYTSIESLDVSKNIRLKKLFVYDSEISELDLKNNLELEVLYCDDTNISSLDLSSNTNLIQLQCSFTNITELDLSQNTKLELINCMGNEISSIDVSCMPNLGFLNCGNTNISEIDVSNNTELWSLSVSNTQISALDISNNGMLVGVFLSGCKELSNLDLSNSDLIQEVYIDGTSIEELNLTGKEHVSQVVCNDNVNVIGCNEDYIDRVSE